MDASEMPRRETPERGDGAERRAGGGAARAGPALERGAQAHAAQVHRSRDGGEAANPWRSSIARPLESDPARVGDPPLVRLAQKDLVLAKGSLSDDQSKASGSSTLSEAFMVSASRLAAAR